MHKSQKRAIKGTKMKPLLRTTCTISDSIRSATRKGFLFQVEASISAIETYDLILTFNF